MNKHLKYASYVARHKWYVFVECARRGLFWRGVVHDWHKLLPEEWLPHANYFHGKKNAAEEASKKSTGYIKPAETDDAEFDLAWLRHQKRADHHWQWWLLPLDDGGVKALSMSPEARLEMVCDWIGASRAQGYGGLEGVREWYVKNLSKMRLNDETRFWVEDFLGVSVEDTGQVFRNKDDGSTLYQYGD